MDISVKLHIITYFGCCKNARNDTDANRSIDLCLITSDFIS